jgi:hypothetical protein
LIKWLLVSIENIVNYSINIINYNKLIFALAALAVDCFEEQLYWSDITDQTIKSAKYNGSMVQEFIASNAKSVEGLSVDWINRKIYWTDSGFKRVMAAELSNGTHMTTIVNSSLSNPRGIAVHPNRR